MNKRPLWKQLARIVIAPFAPLLLFVGALLLPFIQLAQAIKARDGDEAIAAIRMIAYGVTTLFVLLFISMLLV